MSFPSDSQSRRVRWMPCPNCGKILKLSSMDDHLMATTCTARKTIEALHDAGWLQLSAPYTGFIDTALRNTGVTDYPHRRGPCTKCVNNYKAVPTYRRGLFVRQHALTMILRAHNYYGLESPKFARLVRLLAGQQETTEALCTLYSLHADEADRWVAIDTVLTELEATNEQRTGDHGAR